MPLLPPVIGASFGCFSITSTTPVLCSFHVNDRGGLDPDLLNLWPLIGQRLRGQEGKAAWAEGMAGLWWMEAKGGRAQAAPQPRHTQCLKEAAVTPTTLRLFSPSAIPTPSSVSERWVIGRHRGAGAGLHRPGRPKRGSGGGKERQAQLQLEAGKLRTWETPRSMGQQRTHLT
ncbi:hypothetical protein B0T24DRAFT_95859 [Lasiosphaeria ovina]|uniref:Uncharacterized protein n=1 Tax=Lasiosphaeria ovina TaxID=92902 RepID=A0AAE0JUI8_9PEZI|nr:hypothetical protein B0T24DRAFT_95859 [Lasiosphaeria ovina]